MFEFLVIYLLAVVVWQLITADYEAAFAGFGDLVLGTSTIALPTIALIKVAEWLL